MGDVWFASLGVAISKGGREFAQKWRMIKQLKLAAEAKNCTNAQTGLSNR